MFELNGKMYDFKFSVARIDLIEQRCGNSLVSIVKSCGGALPVHFIKACFGLALKDTSNTDVFVAFGDGEKLAEQAIEEIGYFKTSEIIAEALDRDVPFFFRAG